MASQISLKVTVWIIQDWDFELVLKTKKLSSFLTPPYFSTCPSTSWLWRYAIKNTPNELWILYLSKFPFFFLFFPLPLFSFVSLFFNFFCKKSNLITLTAWDVLQFLQDTYKCDQILIPLFSALTVFFSPLASECTPHAAPGSLSTFPVLRSHLGPSRQPLSRFLGRDENTLSETGSSASQNIVSGWGYPFVRSACFYLCRHSGRQEVQRIRPCRGDKGREAELASSTAQPGDETGELLQHTGAGMLARAGQHLTLSGEKQKNAFQMARVKWSTRSPHLGLPRSPLAVLLPIRTLVAGAVMKCHLFWRQSSSVST